MHPVLVGTIHLPSLPGSALGSGADSIPAMLDRATRDAKAYAKGGAQAVIVENFGDIPFVKDQVHPHTIAAMTLAVEAVRSAVDLPVGVNVLRNDVLSAVSIAAVTGASFVRANVYVGASLTDQGIIEGRAEAVQALIRRLGEDIQVWADVDVKHASPLVQRPIGEVALDALERGLASAVIVSGRATGQAVDVDDLREVREAIGNRLLYIGSGATVANIANLLEIADGAIVGTAAKVDGVVTNPVDARRVADIRNAARVEGRRPTG